MVRSAIIMTILLFSIFGIVVTVLFFDGEGSGIMVALLLLSAWGMIDINKHGDKL